MTHKKNPNMIRTKEQQHVARFIYFNDRNSSLKFLNVFENRFKAVEIHRGMRDIELNRYGVYLLLQKSEFDELRKYIKLEKTEDCYRNREWYFRGFEL